MSKQYWAVKAAEGWKRSSKLPCPIEAWTEVRGDEPYPEDAIGEHVRPLGRNRDKADVALAAYQEVAQKLAAQQSNATHDVEASIIKRLREMVDRYNTLRDEMAAKLAGADRNVVWIIERYTDDIIIAQEQAERARSILSAVERGHNPIKIVDESRERATGELIDDRYRANSTSALHNTISAYRRAGCSKFVQDWRIASAQMEHDHRERARVALGMAPTDLDAWWGSPAPGCTRCKTVLDRPADIKWLERGEDGTWDADPYYRADSQHPFCADCTTVVERGEDESYPLNEGAQRRARMLARQT